VRWYYGHHLVVSIYQDAASCLDAQFICHANRANNAKITVRNVTYPTQNPKARGPAVVNNMNIPPAYTEKQQQARGIFGFVRMLGTATERLFRRSYAEQEAVHRTQLQHMAEAHEAEISHLTAVLESIGEGVIMQDVDGRIIMMNKAANEMLGSQKAFWESAFARLHEQAQTDVQSPLEIVPIGEPVRAEINNRILGAQIAAVADARGGRLGTVIVLSDMTRAALAERLKDDFITQISHELRTPLTAIKGMSDVLLSQPEDRPPNRRFLEAISRNVDVLDRMIVELLDISEITGGTFAVRQKDVDLDDLIWSVLRGLRPRWERAGLEIHFLDLRKSNAKVLGDDRRLRWALGHLVENSINYTPAGGKITIITGEVRQNRVLVRVKDNGVGINEKDLPHIFNRFYRGEARTSEGKVIDPRGLGQGLFIARAVSEAHGGFLTVESTVNQGSVFTMTLPREATPLPEGQAQVQKADTPQ
jgi:two-component system phosphate regulon sensor histidine kinase PhoR